MNWVSRKYKKQKSRQRKSSLERKAFIQRLLEHTNQRQYKSAGHVKRPARGFLQGLLEAEKDNELGYSKYDYANKETDNSRNGYSKKNVVSSMDGINLDIPRDRNREFEPQIVKNHPLDKKYAIVFMDAVHYNVRQDNAIVKKAVYIAIDIKFNGSKEVLGKWIGSNKSAKYWLGVLNEMKNRGVETL